MKYTVKEVLKKLNINRSTLQNYDNYGILKPVERKGKTVLYNALEVDKFKPPAWNLTEVKLISQRLGDRFTIKFNQNINVCNNSVERTQFIELYEDDRLIKVVNDWSDLI